GAARSQYALAVVGAGAHGGELAPELGTLLVPFADPRLQRLDLLAQGADLGGIVSTVRLALHVGLGVALTELRLEIPTALLQVADPAGCFLKRRTQALRLRACVACFALVL